MGSFVGEKKMRHKDLTILQKKNQQSVNVIIPFYSLTTHKPQNVRYSVTDLCLCVGEKRCDMSPCPKKGERRRGERGKKSVFM